MDVSKSAAPTQCQQISVNGRPTDIVITTFSDRLFIVITQLGKIGNLVDIRQESAHPDNPTEGNTAFSIRVLLGRDDEEVRAAARFLADSLKAPLPLLLSLCLDDYQPATLKVIAAALGC